MQGRNVSYSSLSGLFHWRPRLLNVSVTDPDSLAGGFGKNLPVSTINSSVTLLFTWRRERIINPSLRSRNPTIRFISSRSALRIIPIRYAVDLRTNTGSSRHEPTAYRRSSSTARNWQTRCTSISVDNITVGRRPMKWYKSDSSGVPFVIAGSSTTDTVYRYEKPDRNGTSSGSGQPTAASRYW